MVGSYDFRLVALSVFISMLGAYASVELAERVTAARGRAWLWWGIDGAAASGLGTWSMHYTGMLSFSLPVPVLYDWPTVVISFLPAAVSAAVALFLVNSWNLRWGRALAGSIFIGGGIATMHYTGMASMRFEGMCRYSPSLVAVSVILAILLLLIKLSFLFRDEATPPWLRKAASVLLLGAANPVMHYTGMAATTFLQSSELPDVSHAVSVSLLAAEAITIVPIMVLAVAAVTSVVDRLREQGTLLEHALDAALEASRVKSAFIANTSHEIRTPLNVITGYVDLIGDHLAEQNDESLKDYVEGTKRACARLLRTIGNMLDMSKIEAGAFDLAPTQLEIGRWLEHLLADLRVMAEQKGIALTCTIDAPNASVVFEEYCLTQALKNLLDNALKFTERGSVSCRLYRATDGTLCLEIRDTGIGIGEEYLPHLFEPFSQERSGLARQFQGSGLGLALTRKYLELNGARISVQTERGQGTTFTIHFSPESEDKKRQPRQSAKPPREASPRPVILVVDDDAETQQYMRAVLQQRYDVLSAASGKEMREVLEARPDVALVLMDLALDTDEDGLTLTRYLRGQERWRQLPIIAVTAFAAPEDRERALEAGCDDYLSKPISRQNLFAEIDALVSRQTSV
jgi:signal transduction histidine kinase/ActR/RegA family two-component response regulator